MHSKASKVAVLAAVCLWGIETTRSAQAAAATEWSGGQVIELGGLPDRFESAAAINDVGCGGSGCYATEWRGGHIIDLGVLYPSNQYSIAYGINPDPAPEQTIDFGAPAILVVSGVMLGAMFLRRRRPEPIKRIAIE